MDGNSLEEERLIWTASSPITGPKWVCKGLVDLSTMSHGCTYGLGRVALAQGQTEEARALGQESLRLFSSIGNQRAAEVETWLNETFA